MAYSGSMTNASGTKDKPSAGDPIPPKCSVIEVHVGELKQLFNAIDPSPFRDKDLDPKAEEFIVGWAKELPRDATLALVIEHLLTHRQCESLAVGFFMPNSVTETKAQLVERLKREKNPWEGLDEIRRFSREGFTSIPPEWIGTYFRWWGVYTRETGLASSVDKAAKAGHCRTSWSAFAFPAAYLLPTSFELSLQ